MTATTLDAQLTKYLTDAHSIERQALAQMKLAPRLAGDPAIARLFAEHRAQTEGHEQRIAERLHARGASPSVVKDTLGSLTGAGFGVFAAMQPDTPGKLVAHAYSYEHMEEAAYDLLARVAERAQDAATVETARAIEQEERAMGQRLQEHFDDAIDASLRLLGEIDIDRQLHRYLADAHALEGQALVLLGRGPKLAGTHELADTYESHRAQTEEHRRLIEQRLSERGDSPSKIKDAALALGALNWGAFFAAQPDTAAKLAAFTYAFEHLEIAAYELLARVARRAGDQDTAGVAEQILAQERAAADHVRDGFDGALDASLGAVGAAA